MRKHGNDFPGSHFVALPQEVALIPLTESLRVTINQGVETRQIGSADFDGFVYLTPTIAAWLSRISEDGAVAYVEVECYGGPCQRSAAIWDRGNLRHLAYDDDEWLASLRIPPVHNPVNQVLRYLGVSTEGSRDEFDALGFGRHRRTEDWAL